jgi:hypothetical protein
MQQLFEVNLHRLRERVEVVASLEATHESAA